VLHHLPLPRHHFQCLGYILAELGEPPRAAAGAGIGTGLVRASISSSNSWIGSPAGTETSIACRGLPYLRSSSSRIAAIRAVLLFYCPVLRQHYSITQLASLS